MTIEIRRARADEAGELTELCLRSKQSNGYDDAFMAACRDELTITPDRLEEGEYWVAVSDSLCGCACLLVDQASKTGEVHAFFIDPACQRRGIGRRLWKKLLERAGDCGLSRLDLEADPFAVPFYQALGFRIVGEAPSGSIPGRMIPTMQLDLAPQPNP
ncbi:MAG: GNAT family N-acetyltransferase [Pseudomonadota bacterium]